MSWKRWLFGIFLLVVGVAAISYMKWPRSSRGNLNSNAPASDFTLLDHLGNIHKLHGYANKKSVILVGASLACSKDFARLEAATQQAAAAGSQILSIAPASPNERKALLDLGIVGVPILLDASGAVAKTFGLENFEDVVELVPPAWKVTYRGSLAARFHLEGVSRCSLPTLAIADLSFEKSVAPVIQKKCMNCHSSQSRFPPVLDNYASLRRWSAMIRETLLTDRMPPFSADPLYGTYRNDISLTAQEKRLLIDWIDAEMPRASETDFRLVTPPRKRKWPAKEPLYSAAMAEPFKVPAKGTIAYKYFQLGGAAPFDMWVTAVHTESTNPRQLHHQSLMVVSKPLSYFEKFEAARKSAIDKEDLRAMDASVRAFIHWKFIDEASTDKRYARMQNWAAGKAQPIVFGKKAALFIPKGYYIILEAHHMGTGREEEELTKINFYGDRKSNGRNPIRGLEILAPMFEIPSGEANFPVQSNIYPVEEDINVLSLLGHMHMRGRSVKLMVNEPDGETKILASIPDYYYGWQTGSGLIPQDGIAVRKGSKLWASCVFDNSAQNPNNPDPTKAVKRGQRVDRTEMCKMNVQFIRQ